MAVSSLNFTAKLFEQVDLPNGPNLCDFSISNFSGRNGGIEEVEKCYQTRPKRGGSRRRFRKFQTSRGFPIRKPACVPSSLGTLYKLYFPVKSALSMPPSPSQNE